jgi:hypothetical protein
MGILSLIGVTNMQINVIYLTVFKDIYRGSYYSVFLTKLRAGFLTLFLIKKFTCKHPANYMLALKL